MKFNKNGIKVNVLWGKHRGKSGVIHSKTELGYLVMIDNQLYEIPEDFLETQL